MKNTNKERIATNFSCIFVVIYILIVLFITILKGGNIYIPVHDNLDSHITYYKVLHDSHQFFSGADTIVDYMGGIDRDFLPSELKLYCLPFAFLEPLPAMVLIYIARIIISVLGGLYFANSVLKEKTVKYKNIIILCSFIYGILPSAPVWNLCFAIYPFLFAQIYRIYNGEARLKDALILFAVPFFSELAHFGVFLCGYLLLLIIFDWVMHKKPNKLLIIALPVMSAGYVISEYRMFRLIVLKGAVTIRVEFAKDSYTFLESIFNVKDAFLNSQYHCATVHKYIVLPLCILYLSYLLYSYAKHQKIFSLVKNPFFLVMLWILLNSSLSGLAVGYEPFNILFTKVFPFMKGIQFDNVLRINSFLWYFEFAYILIKIHSTNIKWLSYVLCFCAITVIFHEPTPYNTIKFNSDKLYLELKGYKYGALSYNEFYSESLLGKVKEDINYSGEWSIAFGMDPAILSYNQIATLDGYHSWYTLDYKHRFRALIAPSLENSENWRKYFDNWGGRAYIFSEEVSYQPVSNLGISIADIDIDVDVFRSMGGKYIFSRVEIGNAEDKLLQLDGIYTDESSPYVIYVYETR